jgi:hypothetical protein
MRNIWVYVVGGMVAIGAIVSIKGIIGNSESSQSTAQKLVVTATDNVAPAKVEAPKPDASFDKVEIMKDDFIFGKETAPVTLVEYASLTCPHCAQFHQNTLPAIKKEYIETGKVKLVYRDFPLDQLALSGSMIARCAGRDRYYAFIDVMFAQQATWARDHLRPCLESLGLVACHKQSLMNALKTRKLRIRSSNSASMVTRSSASMPRPQSSSTARDTAVG